MGDALKKAVLAYVKNGDESDKQAIIQLNQWTTLTTPRTVYRGQGEDSAEKDPSKLSLFSVSTDRTIAVEEFAGKKGCVWTIQLLPGVQIIDVNAVAGDHGKDFEAELLVKGGGAMKFTVSRDPACKIAATYGPAPPPPKEVTLDALKQRAAEIGDDLSETIEDFKHYLNPGEVFKGGRRRTRKLKRQFLYNPRNTKKSFDVYIDKNPSDTIPIRYATIDDVKHTIQKLERLFKAKKYPHKRIWQVAMIMKVRLEVLKDSKPKQYALANRYFKFVGKRTALTDTERRAQTFTV